MIVSRYARSLAHSIANIGNFFATRKYLVFLFWKFTLDSAYDLCTFRGIWNPLANNYKIKTNPSRQLIISITICDSLSSYRLGKPMPYQCNYLLRNRQTAEMRALTQSSIIICYQCYQMLCESFVLIWCSVSRFIQLPLESSAQSIEYVLNSNASILYGETDSLVIAYLWIALRFALSAEDNLNRNLFPFLHAHCHCFWCDNRLVHLVFVSPLIGLFEMICAMDSGIGEHFIITLIICAPMHEQLCRIRSLQCLW